MSDFVTVARLEELEEGKPRGVEVEDQRVVLVRRDGDVHALEDRCSHEDFPLHNGEVLDSQIECALHGARFDLETGTPKALPAVKPVRRYECRIEDGEVQIKL